MRRRAYEAVAAFALLAIAVFGYWVYKLWHKSDDLLRPVVITTSADARALVEPSVRQRFAVLFGPKPAPPATPVRLIALTFDDGPYPVTTPLLLQTLHDLHVPATFFLIGRDAEQFPDLARAIAADGDEIADHTLTHPDLTKLDEAAQSAELRGGTAALQRIAPDPSEGVQFRPPHGRYVLATIRAAQAAGLTTVLWSDDPGDWRAVPAEAIESHLLQHATAPEIALLHSGRQATIAMLPDLVTRYRRAGYTFVTVGDLLRRVPVEQLNHPVKVPFTAASGGTDPRAERL